MVKNLLLLCFVLLFVSCSLDDHKEKVNSVKKIPKIQLRNASDQAPIAKHKLPESPSKELKQEVYNLLTQWDEWDEFNSNLNSENCRLRWNWSILDKMDNGEYTITIPVTNDQNAINLYIMYSTVDDHSHFHIMTIRELIDETENFTKMNIDEKYIPFILKTAIYDYYIYDRTDGRLSNWFQQYFSINDSKIQTRTSFGYYWVDSYVINGLWDSYKVSSKVFFKIPCPIDDQGVTGGDRVNDDDDGWKDGWFNGIGGENNNNDINDNDDFIEPYKDCLEEHAGIGVIAFLLNSEFDFPCETDSDELISQALDKLCEEAEDEVSFSGIEGSNSPGYTFGEEEVLEELSSILENIYDEVYEGDCDNWDEPCWTEVLGEHSEDAVDVIDWCDNFSGFNFGDFNSRGWFIDGQSPQFIDNEFRYLIDPTNENYIIDMRHFLFIGFYLEMTTSTGNALGDFIEFGQLFFEHAEDSALNWQDFYSNRMGSEFARFLIEGDINWDDENTNLGDLICEFLDSPAALRLRPFPNPEDC